MAKTLEQWIDTDVAAVKDKPLSWISQNYFFRDPSRPVYSNPSYFFSPADGTILYQSVVKPDEAIVEIKGKMYTLRDAIRDQDYDQTCLVIGIFMSFYDVHINRIPYPGRLCYKELETIDSYNYPMLDIEKGLLEELFIDIDSATYLHNNQRMLNTVYSPALESNYYILQLADYDVDSITPFSLHQNEQCAQGGRFSQIRYGSQVDLIIPLSDKYEFTPLLETGMHVEAGVDTLVRVEPKNGQNSIFVD